MKGARSAILMNASVGGVLAYEIVKGRGCHKYDEI